MKSFFFKVFLLITFLSLSSGDLLAQYSWTKYAGNPLNVHGTPGSWNQSVTVPCVIFNSDLNRYEMWFTAFTGATPNPGIGFTYSDDGISWASPILVMTPGPASWESLFVGGVSVIKEDSLYKMWYTGYPPLQIGYATSPDGINWTKDDVNNPVLSPGTGWESGGVGYPSVIKVPGGYWMFYSGEVWSGVTRTGRAFSTDGITWQKDTVNNPVLLPGDPGEWDQNNFLARVMEIDNTLYMCYTAETVPGNNGTSAIGFATSTDFGITWAKDAGNPIITRGTTGSWDAGRIETGCIVYTSNELRIYYDGSGPATGNMGRIGLATAPYELPLPSGTYTVGTSGIFATIQDAFTKLETDGVAGNVTLELIDELYTAPTDSFGFKLNGPIPGAGPNSRITIKPAENKNVVIEGNGLAVLYLINTSYITFDGVSITGLTTLTVHAYENNQFEYNLGLFFIDNSDHNIIQNSIFINDDILRRSPALGVSSFSYTAATPDSNLIQSNFVKQAGIGIYVSAYYSIVPATANSNIIRKNIIGSETDTLISWGIQVERNQNAIIEDNVIEGIRGGSSDFIITHGIGCWGCTESIIRNNIVHNVNTSYTGGSMGIALLGDGSIVGNGNLVYNNMVYDINSSSSAPLSNIGGIHLEYQNNIKVYYNSVYLSGTGANQQGSGAFYIWTPGNNIEAKNNIFVNTRDEGQFCASAIHMKTLNTVMSSSDFNVLYYEPNNYNCLVKSNTGSYHSLTEWQATGYDMNSYVEMPHFISPTDLHIDKSIATYLESRGTPIAGIETDIDDDTRNSSTPDIGADEFDGIVGVENETNLPTEFALEQNYPNPFNPSTKISWQSPVGSQQSLKVYDVLGNEVTTLVNEYKPAGRYEVEFDAINLPSGVYFYQLQAGEFINTRKMILLK